MVNESFDGADDRLERLVGDQELTMADTKTDINLDSQRGPGRQSEYELEKTPAREGEPPRPATEPAGSKGSSNSGETATDPATGIPNP